MTFHNIWIIAPKVIAKKKLKNVVKNNQISSKFSSGSWNVIKCHEMSFNLTWWHFMTYHDIWWHFMIYDISYVYDMIYHEMSWQIMKWLKLIEWFREETSTYWARYLMGTYFYPPMSILLPPICFKKLCLETNFNFYPQVWKQNISFENNTES